MSLNTQFFTMAAMALSGAGFGLLFDVYRVLARELRLSRWLIPPLDLLFWIVGTLILFRVLYISNGGEVRVYIFLELLIGVCFYFGLLSGTFIRFLRWLVGKVKQLIRLTLRMTDLLVIRPIIALYRLSLILFGFLLAFSMFMLKIMLQLVYPLWKLLLWVFRPVGRKLYELIAADQWLMPLARRLARWVNWKKW